MALYLGSDKIQIYLDGILYKLNLYSEKPITNGILLLSSDGYVLKDVNELYLTTKKEDE